MNIHSKNDKTQRVMVMIIKLNMLQDIYSRNAHNCYKFVDFINETCERYQINTINRLTYFIAQIGYESDQLIYTQEIWGPTEAQKKYENNKSLGNTMPGDGYKYRGRGLIQLTGRANYQRISDAMKINFIDNPELLEEPKFACLSAGWYWDTHKLNELADQTDFIKITKLINGGLNGLQGRENLLQQAVHFLKLV